MAGNDLRVADRGDLWIGNDLVPGNTGSQWILWTHGGSGGIHPDGNDGAVVFDEETESDGTVG